MEFGLSLGSNLGDRVAHLREARKRIRAIEGLQVAACSSLYETEPVGVRPEFRDRRFLNAVLAVECALLPDALAARLHAIEAEMGRVRGEDRNAPRPVDIDVIYAERVQIRSETLTIPHPRWAERRFVAQPLAEIRPALVLPGVALSVEQVLRSLPYHPEVVLCRRRW